MQQTSTDNTPFPTGLKVMVVDDDPLCLKVIEQMLRRCNYKVTTCQSSTKALEVLREHHQQFDIVLSDVYMPDMDGFKLLELIGLEIGLPVIMMSSNGETNVVFRGVTHGAVDFLIKPVRVEELRNLWQHVVRKTLGVNPTADRGHSEEVDDDDIRRADRKRKDVKQLPREQLDDCAANAKKQRVVWSVEMHQQFVTAVNQLGIDKAVPKRILDLMNVEGLTRENVASHLQKYRLYLKRVQGINTSAGKSNSSSKGLKLEPAATTGLPPMIAGHPGMPMGMMPPAMMIGLPDGSHPFMPGFMPGMMAGMPPGTMLPPGMPGLPPGMAGMMGIPGGPMMPAGLSGMMPGMQPQQHQAAPESQRSGSLQDPSAQGMSPEPVNGHHASPSMSSLSQQHIAQQSQVQQQQQQQQAGPSMMGLPGMSMLGPMGPVFSAPPGAPAGFSMDHLQQGMMAMAQQGVLFPGMMGGPMNGMNGMTPQAALQQQMATLAMGQQHVPPPQLSHASGSGGASSVPSAPVQPRNGLHAVGHMAANGPAAPTPSSNVQDQDLQNELSQLCQVELGGLRGDLDNATDPLASIGGVLGGLSEAATMDLGRGEGPPDEFLAFLLKENVME